MQRLGGPLVRKGRKIQFADGWYRFRRGKLVRIPDEWVGKPERLCGPLHRYYRKFKGPQSKQPRKVRMRDWPGGGDRVPKDRIKRAKKKGHCVCAGHGMRPRNRSPRHLGRRDRRYLERECDGE